MSEEEAEYSLRQGFKALRIQADEEGEIIYISVENTHETEGTMAYGVTIGIPFGDVEFVMNMLQRAAGSAYNRRVGAQYLAPADAECAKMGVGLGAAFVPTPGIGPIR